MASGAYDPKTGRTVSFYDYPKNFKEMRYVGEARSRGPPQRSDKSRIERDRTDEDVARDIADERFIEDDQMEQAAQTRAEYRETLEQLISRLHRVRGSLTQALVSDDTQWGRDHNDIRRRITKTDERIDFYTKQMADVVEQIRQAEFMKLGHSYRTRDIELSERFEIIKMAEKMITEELEEERRLYPAWASFKIHFGGVLGTDLWRAGEPEYHNLTDENIDKELANAMIRTLDEMQKRDPRKSYNHPAVRPIFDKHAMEVANQWLKDNPGRKPVSPGVFLRLISNAARLTGDEIRPTLEKYRASIHPNDVDPSRARRENLRRNQSLSQNSAKSFFK